MITFNVSNLRLFIPQYVVATVLTIFMFLFLGRRFPGKERTVPRLNRKRRYPSSPFCTPVTYLPSHVSGTMIDIHLTLTPVSGSLSNYWAETGRFFSPLSHFLESGFPCSFYETLTSEFQQPPFFEANTTYLIYRILISISVWAGLMLVITPFSYIYVFLPHFSDPYNIVVAIVLSISVFEGLISTVFFRIGVKFTRIALVEGFVVIAFTFSILSPSMSWLGSFDMQSRLLIYLVLLVLFCTITALISQLRTKENHFLSSMIFASISYFTFAGVVLYNILNIAGI